MLHKIGITGSRKGMNSEQKLTLHSILDAGDNIELHVGCCIGVDEEVTEAAAEFRRYCPIRIVGHPPINKTSQMKAMSLLDEVRPDKEYYERNRDIVHATSHLLVIPYIWPITNKRSGTLYTYNYAWRTCGTPYSILMPSGKLI